MCGRFGRERQIRLWQRYITQGEAAPKAAPNIAVLLQREGEKRPHAVDVGGELRGGGRGELEELARLVVREMLG